MMGGSKVRLTVKGIRSIRFGLRPPASGAFGPALVGTIAAGSGRRIGLWQAGPERSREGCSCVETRRILPAEAWAWPPFPIHDVKQPNTQHNSFPRRVCARVLDL